MGKRKQQRKALAAEEQRVCTRCDFRWYAPPPGRREPKPRWSDETWAVTGNATARVQRLSANYDRQQSALHAYAVCPNCNSRAVVTTKDKDFTPTGAVSRDHHDRIAEERAAPAGVASRREAEAKAAQTAQNQVVAAKAGTWLGTHWRALIAILFAIAPIGSVTSARDDSIYTHGVALNILLGVLVFGGCWAIAAIAARSEVRRRSKASEA